MKDADLPALLNELRSLTLGDLVVLRIMLQTDPTLASHQRTALVALVRTIEMQMT